MQLNGANQAAVAAAKTGGPASGGKSESERERDRGDSRQQSTQAKGGDSPAEEASPLPVVGLARSVGPQSAAGEEAAAAEGGVAAAAAAASGSSSSSSGSRPAAIQSDTAAQVEAAANLATREEAAVAADCCGRSSAQAAQQPFDGGQVEGNEIVVHPATITSQFGQQQRSPIRVKPAEANEPTGTGGLVVAPAPVAVAIPISAEEDGAEVEIEDRSQSEEEQDNDADLKKTKHSKGRPSAEMDWQRSPVAELKRRRLAIEAATRQDLANFFAAHKGK